MKRLIALLLALMMVLALTACGGGGDKAAEPAAEGEEAAEPAAEGGEEAAASGDKVTLTVFNTKSEIQTAMEAMAEEYSASHNVDMEIYYSNDTVAAHMATKYASNDPYVLSMVDAKDIYSLGPEHAIDLSDESWVANTDQAISVDGKVLGFPVCVEARGVMYNADAIEAITGEEFKPEDYATLDAFKGLLDELKAGGMETPVGVMKEDWSLAGHFLAEVYEQRDDVQGFVDQLKAGEVKLMDDEKFNSLMDYFDVMKENNYAASSAIAAERETSEMMLAQGDIAFMFGGNWDWALIAAYDYTEHLGMMPIPQNMDDGTNEKLVGGGSKYFFIDNAENITDEQRQAAKDFLDWLVNDPAGNEFLTVDCALVPAYSNIAADNLDPLGASVKAKADEGNLIENYNYLPDDHYSKCGAEMQKYLAGQCTREDLAAAVESYWASVQ